MQVLTITESEKPLGTGKFYKSSSILDSNLLVKLRAYKNRVCGKYQYIKPEEIYKKVSDAKYFVSRKYDGETWFLVKNNNAVFLAATNGRVICDIELIKEAEKVLLKYESIIIAGELYVNSVYSNYQKNSDDNKYFSNTEYLNCLDNKGDTKYNKNRERVFDLSNLFAKRKSAATKKLKFAAFDILEFSENNYQKDLKNRFLSKSPDKFSGNFSIKFSNKVKQLKNLFKKCKSCHDAGFIEVDNHNDIKNIYDNIVVKKGAEGIVLRSDYNEIIKIKPEITVDAAVIGFTSADEKIVELLTALIDKNGVYRVLGRINTGFSKKERYELFEKLSNLSENTVKNHIRAISRNGLLFTFVKPKIIIEIKCNDIIYKNKDGILYKPVYEFDENNGFVQHYKKQSASLINGVFKRTRNDKQLIPNDVGMKQVFLTEKFPATVDNDEIIKTEQNGLFFKTEEKLADEKIKNTTSEILKREVFVKNIKSNTSIKKAILVKTNKNNDENWLPFVILLSDYSPKRADTLKRSLKPVKSEKKGEEWIKNWKQDLTNKGWEQFEDWNLYQNKLASKANVKTKNSNNNELQNKIKTVNITDMKLQASSLISQAYKNTQVSSLFSITISFARSISPSFYEAVRRSEILGEKCGFLNIEKDEKDRIRRIEVNIYKNIIEYSGRIKRLVTIISGWKSGEVCLGEEPLDKYETDKLLFKLNTIRKCFSEHKKIKEQKLKNKVKSEDNHQNLNPDYEENSASDVKNIKTKTCECKSKLGCSLINMKNAVNKNFTCFEDKQPYYAAGEFDGAGVKIEKGKLLEQLDLEVNSYLELCPDFNKENIIKNIKNLPERIEPDNKKWIYAYDSYQKKPAWVIPKDLKWLPFGFSKFSDFSNSNTGDGLSSNMSIKIGNITDESTLKPVKRNIPKVKFADIKGQDKAIETVFDTILLPFNHVEHFEKLGLSATGSGALLYGPPGNGKTLIAKAIASEMDALIEIISGPELLSKWMGESEEKLRSIFLRAKEFAPSVILFDELDAIAPVRSASLDHSYKGIVAQLLVLLDGLESRGSIYVLGTTNRIDDIDKALLRPGRFDNHVFVGPPDKKGRADIFKLHLLKLKTANDINFDLLSELTKKCSGADIAYICKMAATICVKESLKNSNEKNYAPVIKNIHVVSAISNMTTTKKYVSEPKIKTRGFVPGFKQFVSLN